MIGENLLYLMVWMVIILVPVLNSKMLEEVHVSLENILIAWLKIAPYLLIFIIHNSLIAPRLLLRKHRYVWYLVVNLLTITAVFSLVAIYEKIRSIRHRTLHPERQSVIHRSGDLLEHPAGILHDGPEHGYQTAVSLPARRTANGGAQTSEPASGNGLSAIPDQPPISS